jgi:hypothetical protein
MSPRGRQLTLSFAADELVAWNDGAVSSMSGRRCVHSTAVALGLNHLHDLQHVAQALVVHDRALVHGAELLVDGIGQ